MHGWIGISGCNSSLFTTVERWSVLKAGSQLDIPVHISVLSSILSN